MVCAAKGYKAHFVSSDAFTEEKLQTMRAFGATVEVIPSVDRKVTPELIASAVARVQELAEAPNTFWTDQFNNPDNRSGYYPMAEEIINALDGKVDAFIMGVGTGGSFSGNADVLKNRLVDVRCIALEPDNSRALSGAGPLGGHRLEGMGAGFPHLYARFAVRCQIMHATVEGIFGGLPPGQMLGCSSDRPAVGGLEITSPSSAPYLKYYRATCFTEISSANCPARCSR